MKSEKKVWKKKIIVTKKKLKRMFQLVHIFLYIYIYRQEFIFSLGINVKIKIIIQRKFFPIKTNENFNWIDAQK